MVLRAGGLLLVLFGFVWLFYPRIWAKTWWEKYGWTQKLSSFVQTRPRIYAILFLLCSGPIFYVHSTLVPPATTPAPTISFSQWIENVKDTFTPSETTSNKELSTDQSVNKPNPANPSQNDSQTDIDIKIGRVTCDEFDSRKEAQRYYDRYKKREPEKVRRLDQDRDGRACEDLD